MKLGYILSVTGFFLGAALLALQLSLTIPARMATGASFSSSIIFYVSFFTILSNIGVVLTYLSALTKWRWLSWFRDHRTRTMLASLILIVMLVYHFVLAGIWAPAGLFKVADIGLHYAAPVTYLLWWAALPRSQSLNLTAIKAMMVPPLVYILYVLARGHITGLYPYPFVNVGVLGIRQVGLNAFGLFVFTAAMMAIFVALDRVLLKLKK